MVPSTNANSVPNLILCLKWSIYERINGETSAGIEAQVNAGLGIIGILVNMCPHPYSVGWGKRKVLFNLVLKYILWTSTFMLVC